MLQQKTLVHLKWLCRGVIFLTALFSVWANVLHVKQVTIPAIIFAAAPPLIVLASFEMVSRIPMQDTAKWYNRWARPSVTALISGGGAWLSYWHQRDAIYRYNAGDIQNASILPLLIDGLMIVASVSVIELTRQIRAIQLRKVAAEQAQKAKVVPAQEAARQTGRERIAAALHEMPWGTIKEIAARAGTKDGYTGTVVAELRKAQRTNGHTAVPVTTN